MAWCRAFTGLSRGINDVEMRSMCYVMLQVNFLLPLWVSRTSFSEVWWLWTGQLNCAVRNFRCKLISSEEIHQCERKSEPYLDICYWNNIGTRQGNRLWEHCSSFNLGIYSKHFLFAPQQNVWEVKTLAEMDLVFLFTARLMSSSWIIQAVTAMISDSARFKAPVLLTFQPFHCTMPRDAASASSFIYSPNCWESCCVWGFCRAPAPPGTNTRILSSFQPVTWQKANASSF